jgi:hypothetical protein
VLKSREADDGIKWRLRRGRLLPEIIGTGPCIYVLFTEWFFKLRAMTGRYRLSAMTGRYRLRAMTEMRRHAMTG